MSNIYKLTKKEMNLWWLRLMNSPQESSFSRFIQLQTVIGERPSEQQYIKLHNEIQVIESSNFISDVNKTDSEFEQVTLRET